LGRSPFTTVIETLLESPLGEVNFTETVPDEIGPIESEPKVTDTANSVASNVLATGVPPTTRAVSPVVGDEASIVVPAAMGLRRTVLLSATVREKVPPEFAMPVVDPEYQGPERPGMVNSPVFEGKDPV
jgi:hypothetical protein